MLCPFFSPSLSSVVRERRRQSEHSAVQCFDSLSLSLKSRANFVEGKKSTVFQRAFFEFFCLGFYDKKEEEEEEEEEEVA